MTGNKLLRLPAHGRLLVCADLRGNLRDFLKVVARFEELPEDRHLLFLGDLIHGPVAAATEWPAALGRPYQDGSPAILLKLSLLMERYPGRVHALLGNHEHAHIGGPRTARFCTDEATALERRLGGDATGWVRQWLKEWPLCAVAPAGVLLSHRPPAPALRSLQELEDLDYLRYLPIAGSAGTPADLGGGWDEGARILGQMLWSNPLAAADAWRVLASVGLRLSIYGHEVVAGAEAIGDEQLVLSSSFLMPDRDKRVLELDLSGHYRSAAELEKGREILPLY